MSTLCTSSQVKDWLEITVDTYDALLAVLVVRVGDMIEHYLDRIVEQAAVTEFYDGSGTPALVLRNRPIVGVTRIDYSEDYDYDNGQVSVDDYVPDLKRGIVFRKNGMPWLLGNPINHKVAYNAGWATVPKDIEQAAILICAHMFKRRQNPTIVSQSLKDGAITHHQAGLEVKTLLGQIAGYKHRGV